MIITDRQLRAMSAVKGPTARRQLPAVGSEKGVMIDRKISAYCRYQPSKIKYSVYCPMSLYRRVELAEWLLGPSSMQRGGRLSHPCPRPKILDQSCLRTFFGA